jgi:hypothetical protein
MTNDPPGPPNGRPIDRPTTWRETRERLHRDAVRLRHFQESKLLYRLLTQANRVKKYVTIP